MSSAAALVRREPALPQALNAMPTSWADVERLGAVLAQSGFFQDSRQAAQAITKVMAGLELGIPPIAAMTGIHIVKGKVTLGAHLIASQIRRSPRYDYRFAQPLTNEACELEFLDVQSAEPVLIGTSRFTIDDAKKAGLVRPDSPWLGHARNMLFARAMSNGAKWFCPDVFAGPVYTPDEMGATVDYATGEVIELPAGGASAPAGGRSDPPAVQPPAQGVVASSAPPAAGTQGSGVAAWKRLFTSNAIEPTDESRDRVKAVMQGHGLDPKAADSLERLADVRLWCAIRDDVCRQFGRPLHHGLQHEAAGPALVHYDVPSRKDDAVHHVVLATTGRHECDCPHGTKGSRARGHCHHVTEALELLGEDADRFPEMRATFSVLLALDTEPSADEVAADEAWKKAEVAASLTELSGE